MTKIIPLSEVRMSEEEVDALWDLIRDRVELRKNKDFWQTIAISMLNQDAEIRSKKVLDQLKIDIKNRTLLSDEHFIPPENKPPENPDSIGGHTDD